MLNIWDLKTKSGNSNSGTHKGEALENMLEKILVALAQGGYSTAAVNTNVFTCSSNVRNAMLISFKVLINLAAVDRHSLLNTSLGHAEKNYKY